jgi:hypothetical protein
MKIVRVEDGRVVDEWMEDAPPPAPLDREGVAATLNVVLGIWPIEDAANAVGLTPADLEAEALAWGLAGG